MSFSFSKFIKGVRISKENTVMPSNIDIIPGGTGSTTTVLQGAQTANRTVTLPDETGTILTTASTIDLDQLEAVTANCALASNGAGHIVAATTTATELGYVNGVTSSIQTQINTVSSDLSTETAARIAGDSALNTSKANVTLNNILPTTAIDINGQKITNSAAPTVGSDLTNKTYVDAAVTGGGANLTLSNLNTTSINQDLLPSSTNTRSLGSASLRWANLFVSTIQNASAAVIDAVNSRLVSGGTTKLDWSGTDIDVNTRKITSLVDPSSAQHAATKNYVDTSISTATANINKTLRANQSGSNYNITASEITIPYVNVIRNDMGGSYNTGTSVFTAPYSGKYLVTATFAASGTLATTSYMQIALVDATFTALQAYGIIWGTGGNNIYKVGFSEVLELSSGTGYVIKGSAATTMSVNQSSYSALTFTYLGA